MVALPFHWNLRKNMAMTEKIERNGVVGGLVDTFYHALDLKKRLTIPSEWRDALGMNLEDKSVPQYLYVIPNATEDCLDLVPMYEIAKLREAQSQKDILENDPLDAALWNVAQMLKVDSAGRIRIGDDLLDFAGIKTEVTLVGAFRKAQIWAGERRPKAKKLDIAAYRAALAQRRVAKNQG